MHIMGVMLADWLILAMAFEPALPHAGGAAPAHPSRQRSRTLRASLPSWG